MIRSLQKLFGSLVSSVGGERAYARRFFFGKSVDDGRGGDRVTEKARALE
jgi:hypothetical protein